jgi:hypothetical protein
MRAKNALWARVTVTLCLVICLTLASTSDVKADNQPGKKYHADQVYHYSAGTAWTYIHNYYYDCGTLTSILITRPAGNYELRTMEYDASDVLIKQTMQRWSNSLSAWVNNKCTTYYYTNGQLTQELVETWSGGMWKNQMNHLSTYDVNGYLSARLTQMYMGGAWNDMERVTYTYDSMGNQLSVTSQIYMMGVWYDDARGLSSYDPQGNLETKTSQAWTGTQWTTMITSYYAYGPDGNCQNIKTRNSSGVWWTKVEYQYAPGYLKGQTYTWDQGAGDWVIGGMTAIPMSVVVDGVKTDFPTQSGSQGEIYYSQELHVDAGNNQTVYLGYPPAECVNVTAVASGGSPGYIYTWSNGGTMGNISVCPQQSTIYTVTVTDNDGCIAVSQSRICAIDVRCGNNMNKVQLCHCPPGKPDNCKTMCLDVNDVGDHLSHGDLLGACGISHDCYNYRILPPEYESARNNDGPTLSVYPNPVDEITTLVYSVQSMGVATIRLFNTYGQCIKVVYEGIANVGPVVYQQIDLRNISPGIYVCVLQQADGQRSFEKIIIQ